MKCLLSFIALWAAVIGGSAQTKATATEIFNLRSKCGALAEQVRQWQEKENETWSEIARVSIFQISHYDVQANRCYVQITTETVFKSNPNHEALAGYNYSLYDAQSRRRLAVAFKTGYWAKLTA